jgi:hypothetical protein
MTNIQHIIALRDSGVFTDKQANTFINKANRLEAKALKEAAVQRRNLAVSYFLGKFMAPGKPYSIKPFGKDSSLSLLPNLEVEMERSELLSSLQDLREAGLVHDNAGSLKNSCGHRWFVGPKPEAE